MDGHSLLQLSPNLWKRVRGKVEIKVTLARQINPTIIPKSFHMNLSFLFFHLDIERHLEDKRGPRGGRGREDSPGDEGGGGSAAE